MKNARSRAGCWDKQMVYHWLGITFPAFLVWKLVVFAVLAFFGNLWYGLRTGRDLTEDRNLMQRRREQQAAAETAAKTEAGR